MIATDLAASMADVIICVAGLSKGDAVRPQCAKESDVVISDLPRKATCDDATLLAIKWLLVKKGSMPTIWLMEQGLKYLKSGWLVPFF